MKAIEKRVSRLEDLSAANGRVVYVGLHETADAALLRSLAETPAEPGQPIRCASMFDLLTAMATAPTGSRGCKQWDLAWQQMSPCDYHLATLDLPATEAFIVAELEARANEGA